MPITASPEHQRAEAILQDLLTRYLMLNLHFAEGRDLEVGHQLEETFQSHRQFVLDLVAAGLRHGDVLF